MTHLHFDRHTQGATLTLTLDCGTFHVPLDVQQVSCALLELAAPPRALVSPPRSTQDYEHEMCVALDGITATQDLDLEALWCEFLMDHPSLSSEGKVFWMVEATCQIDFHDLVCGAKALKARIHKGFDRDISLRDYLHG
jgi:hypothetical protein